jgi:hypothetical protein
MLIVPADTFILKLSGHKDWYLSVMLWKFSIFEIWVFGIFFVFIIFRLFVGEGNKKPLIYFGPLRPLILFTIAGSIFGIIGTIQNNGNVSFHQIRYYWEGILLYLVVVNTDLRKLAIAKLFWMFIALGTARSFYDLILYFAGHGFNFLGVGYIVTGYGDILQNTVIIALFLSSFLANSNGKNITFIPMRLILYCCLLVNSLVILLSLRRSYIVLFMIGLGTIFISAEKRKKLEILGVVVLIACVSVSFLGFEKNSILNKLLIRVDSINIFKYGDDASEEISSSTGHISEVAIGWNNVRNNIIMGKGFGVKIERKVGTIDEPMMVHNELFFYWIVMGIFGLFVFLSMYLIPMHHFFKRMKSERFRGAYWIYVSMLGFCIGRLILGITFYPPISIVITKAFMYFALLGFIMNDTSYANGNKKLASTASPTRSTNFL